MSSACGHSKTLCRKCGSVVMQCRCMSKDKRIEYVEGCDDCRRPEPPKPGSMAQYNADLAKVLDKFPDEYHTRPGMSGQPYTRLTEDHQIFDPKNPPTKRTHAVMYDRLGAHQFQVLIDHGLRSFHRGLDVGCGSLCLGRLLIPWLDLGNYVGVEPDADLLQQGVDVHVGMELIAKRQATFLQLEDFKLTRTRAQFSFVVAHSVFMFHGPGVLEVLLREAARSLLPDGQFLFTYRTGPKDFTGVVQPGQAAWVRYCKDTMAKMIREAGLKGEHLPTQHPTNQVWVRAQLRGSP